MLIKTAIEEAKESIFSPKTSLILNENLEKKRIFNLGISKNPNFKIDDDNKNSYNQLYFYFTDDKRFLGDLNKGIMLLGRVGSGKTFAMNLFRDWLFKRFERWFLIESVQQIERDYSKGGWEAITRFFENPTRNANGFYENKPATICIDDIGTEIGEVSHFGTRVDVIKQLLYARYDYLNRGIKTHATTNCSLNTLASVYGERLYSRMNEMFNFVKLTAEKDRRL